MFIQQISVFVENKAGRLAQITKVLEDNNLDIRALSIADTRDFGILRLIINDPSRAEKVLKENGFTVSLTQVIAIGVNDHPGGLAYAMKILHENGISVEYMYAFISRTDDMAFVILRVEDNEKAVEILDRYKIKILNSEDIYTM